MDTVFQAADILLPEKTIDMEKWSVIACDQFTSEPEYWEKVKANVAEHPSTLDMILPEVYLGHDDYEKQLKTIESSMNKYLHEQVFAEYKDAMIYVERTDSSGKVRSGIVGKIDLEQYDYRKKSTSFIRATEATVAERIPARVEIRKNAVVELPHVMLLVDDAGKHVIEPCAFEKKSLPLLYDFDLMLGGGHLSGYLLGEKEQVIYGPGYIQDRLCGLTFKISPKSFYQVNPEQTEKLYRKAMEYAGLTGKEKVLDAYCGTGTIGMVAARQAQSVIGVELNKDAVKDAIINAKQNDIHNIRFYNQDAGEFMVELADKQEKVDVVFMDPPRSGSDEKFLSSLVKLQPDRVVYVSCNPETLARDLKYLTKKGYEMKRAVGVDLFPMTVHVECVIMMQYCGKEKKK